jgi:hypothetical protein
MMKETRYDDWDIKYSGNRFAFMGNGYSQTELDPTCDLGYYIRFEDDSPYASRQMRRKVLTKSGTKKVAGPSGPSGMTAKAVKPRL